MADSTTTSKVLFTLGEELPSFDIPAENEELLPYLADPKRWEQYQNESLYKMDKLIRKWIEINSKSSKWMSSYKYRRYTLSMVVEQAFGEKYDAKRHGRYVNQIARLLAYYSSKVQKGGSINGRSLSKTIYTISPKRGKGAPFSLKLRLEWLSERGELPTWRNMRLPKDDLKPGHARNPKTDENMRLRRERAKARYNERYKDRNH